MVMVTAACQPINDVVTAVALTLNGAAVTAAVADRYEEQTYKLYHKPHYPRPLRAAISAFPEGH
jgi:hypothetical protein